MSKREELENIAKVGDVKALNKLLEEGFKPTPKCALFAIEHGHLPFLIRLAEIGVYPDEIGLGAACWGCDISIIEWLHRNHRLPKPGTYARDVEFDSIPSFSWDLLVERGVDTGNILLLAWLVTLGVVLNRKVADRAVIFDQPSVVEWLKGREITPNVEFRELPRGWDEAFKNISLVTPDKTVENRFKTPELQRIAKSLKIKIYGLDYTQQLHDKIVKHFNSSS